MSGLRYRTHALPLDRLGVTGARADSTTPVARICGCPRARVWAKSANWSTQAISLSHGYLRGLG